jgi:hypothetical protein
MQKKKQNNPTTTTTTTTKTGPAIDMKHIRQISPHGRLN